MKFLRARISRKSIRNTRRKLKNLPILEEYRKKVLIKKRFIRERSGRMSKVYKGYELIKAIAEERGTDEEEIREVFINE